MTTAQIALLMMYQLKKEYIDDYAKSFNIDRHIIKFDAAVNWLKDNIEYDEPILIPWTTNYETFIWRDGKAACIDTCNNQDWAMLAGEYDLNPYQYRKFEKAYDDKERIFLDLNDFTTITRYQFRQNQLKSYGCI